MWVSGTKEFEIVKTAGEACLTGGGYFEFVIGIGKGRFEWMAREEEVHVQNQFSRWSALELPTSVVAVSNWVT